LFNILGFADNATLNAAIVNQSVGALTDFAVPLANQYSSLIVQWAGYAGNNSFGVYGMTSVVYHN